MLKLTPAVVAASALHVAVWAGVHGAWRQGTPAARTTPPVVAMQLLPALRVAPQAPAPVMPTTPAIDMASTSVTGEPSAAPDPGAARQADDAQPTPPTEASDAHPAAGFDPDHYWPRPQLTRPPVPRTMVAIDFPVGEPTPGRHKAVLALYIDDEGLVQRVDTSDAQLPEPYIAAARNAFLVARFEPGQIQGQAVRSLIHIEVQFDQAEAAPLQTPTRLNRSFAGLP